MIKTDFFRIDTALFLKLFLAFIAATVIGTVSHELGHYAVARCLGYSASINYASTSWWSNSQDQVIPAEHRFLLILGGPAQTIITGTIGILLLLKYRRQFRAVRQLNSRQWAIVFLALFWLRQPANFLVWLASYLVTGDIATQGDEIRLALHLTLPLWSIALITAIIGLAVLVLVYQFVPPKQKFTFLAAGLTGGIAGYILWIEMLGQYIMP